MEETSDRPRPRLNDLIAEEIRVLLARRRLSASDLARMAGFTQRAISRRLTGEKVIDADDLERIAAVLDVDVADLIPQREGRLIAVGGAAMDQGRDIKRQKPLMPKGTSPLSPNGSRPHIAAPANRRTGRVMPALQAA